MRVKDSMDKETFVNNMPMKNGQKVRSQLIFQTGFIPKVSRLHNFPEEWFFCLGDLKTYLEWKKKNFLRDGLM